MKSEKQLLKEYIQCILDSYCLNEALELHDTLNPLLWDNQNLKEDVKQSLVEIANNFIDNLGFPIDVIDIRFLGSNASYNYNSQSDIDLHIITNFDNNYVDDTILQQLYNNEKNLFNNKHDITVKGIPVELYVEDMKSMNATNGSYSLLKDEWIKIPKPVNYEIPDYSKELDDELSRAQSILTNATSSQEVKDEINHIYLMRKDGLAQGGEASIGNLVFKELRNMGIQSDLASKYYELESNELSLESEELTESRFPINLDKDYSKQDLIDIVKKADKYLLYYLIYNFEEIGYYREDRRSGRKFVLSCLDNYKEEPKDHYQENDNKELKDAVLYAVELYNKNSIKKEASDPTEFDVDRSDIYVHSFKDTVTEYPPLGDGYYLFHVNSVDSSINDPKFSTYYKIKDNANILLIDSLNDDIHTLPQDLLNASLLDSEEYKTVRQFFLGLNSHKEGLDFSDFMVENGIDGVQLLSDQNLYDTPVTNETCIYNMKVLEEVKPKVLVNEMVFYNDVTPVELNSNPCKFTVYSNNDRSEYDFNNLKELFKYVEDCGGFRDFSGLTWFISSNYKDGEFYYERDRFSKGGWHWVDCNGDIVQGTERRKVRGLEETEVEDKYKIFQQIQLINPNAKYSNYKNKSVNEMLAILQSYKNNREKFKSKEQSDEEFFNSEEYVDLMSQPKQKHVFYDTGYDYDESNEAKDEIRKQYNESVQLNEYTLKDVIDDSKASDPRRIELSKSLYTEYKGVDSDGTLIFETDSQTRSGLGHKQRIFYPGFFDMLDKVDHHEKITEEDVVNILTGDLMLDCSCESFLYFAWAYKSWKNDYGLKKETRKPKRNNVNLAGGACKHCLSVLELINHSNTLFDQIAKDLNELFGHYKKTDDIEKEIERLKAELAKAKISAPELQGKANNDVISDTK